MWSQRTQFLIVEINKQILVLVDFSKMCKSSSEYACKVTLPMKKDGNIKFCGDYKLLNVQTRQDSFTKPLIDDVLN
jgi:hypothetical protein